MLFQYYPHSVLFEPQLHGKSSGKILIITRNELFSHFLPAYPAAGHDVNNIWTPACLKCVPFLSRQLQMGVGWAIGSGQWPTWPISGWTISSQTLDKVLLLFNECLANVQPLHTVKPTSWIE